MSNTGRVILHTTDGIARGLTYVNSVGIRRELTIGTRIKIGVEDVSVNTSCTPVSFSGPPVIAGYKWSGDGTEFNREYLTRFGYNFGGDGIDCSYESARGLGNLSCPAIFADTRGPSPSSDPKPYGAYYIDSSCASNVSGFLLGVLIVIRLEKENSYIYISNYPYQSVGYEALIFYATINTCALFDGMVLTNELTGSGDAGTLPNEIYFGENFFDLGSGGQVVLNFCSTDCIDTPPAECVGDYRQAINCSNGDESGLYYAHADVEFGTTWKQSDGTCVRENPFGACTDTSDPPVDMTNPFLNCTACSGDDATCSTPPTYDPDTDEETDPGTPDHCSGSFDPDTVETSAFMPGSQFDSVIASCGGGLCFTGTAPDTVVTQIDDTSSYFGHSTANADLLRSQIDIYASISFNEDTGCWQLSLTIELLCAAGHDNTSGSWYGIKSGGGPAGSYKKCSTDGDIGCFAWMDAINLT